MGLWCRGPEPREVARAFLWACRMLAMHSGDIRHGEAAWPKCFDWFCAMALQLREVIRKIT